MQVSWLIDHHLHSPSQPVASAKGSLQTAHGQWIAFALNEDSLNTVAGPLRLLS